MKMSDSFACVAVKDGPGIIPKHVLVALKAAACMLELNSQDQMAIDRPDVTGNIETDWDAYALGGKSGILFRAEIENTDGTTYRVNFLIGVLDLEYGADLLKEHGQLDTVDDEIFHGYGKIPLPVLYLFENLRKNRRVFH